ncbi:MAG: hypothetical protein WCV50_05830 [Patescibacteria group bacterium]|jgi:hypothetical protein
MINKRITKDVIKQIETLPITVNRKIDAKDAMRDCRRFGFPKVNGDAFSVKFPQHYHHIGDEIIIVSIEEDLSMDEVLEAFALCELKPADVLDLIALVNQHPDAIKESKAIYALFSFVQGSWFSGVPWVSSIVYRYKSQITSRDIWLNIRHERFGFQFKKGTQFAAYRIHHNLGR